MSSPASCLRLSQFAILPRPDHVSLVLGSRYLAFTSYVLAALAPARLWSLSAPSVPASDASRSISEIGSPTSRFKYAMLFASIATSSQPLKPASQSTSTSSVLRDSWFRAIFWYSHWLTAHLPLHCADRRRRAN